MRVDKSSFARTEMHQCVVAICLLLMESILLRAICTVLDDLVLHCQRLVCSGLECLGLVAVVLITDCEGFSGLYLLAEGVSAQTCHVGLEDFALARVFDHDSVCDLAAGIDELDLVLGAFEHGFSVNFHEFIHIAEARCRLAGCDCVTHSV